MLLVLTVLLVLTMLLVLTVLLVLFGAFSIYLIIVNFFLLILSSRNRALDKRYQKIRYIKVDAASFEQFMPIWGQNSRDQSEQKLRSPTKYYFSSFSKASWHSEYVMKLLNRFYPTEECTNLVILQECWYSNSNFVIALASACSYLLLGGSENISVCECYTEL